MKVLRALSDDILGCFSGTLVAYHSFTMELGLGWGPEMDHSDLNRVELGGQQS